MKKLLAMVLALVMTLSLAVSANAAFKDVKDIDETYAESAAVLNGLGVFKGYEEKDGTFSFQPKNAITRAEVAAIVYRIYTGDVKDAYVKNYETYNKFSDMAGAGWAKGYIGYCANAALVKGYPNGTFVPSGKVTGYEVLAMILRAVGYDQKNEFTGADWALHVAEIAERQGILDNVKGVDLNAPATREVVAELLFQSINVPMVTYTAAFGYQNVGLNEKADNKLFAKNETLGIKNFKLDCVTGYVTANDYGTKFKNMQIAGKNLAKKDDTVKVADQDIFDAGRYGHVWTSDGSAITDVFYDDTLLSTTYDGTSYKNLTDKDADEFVAKADEHARFFDNGYEQKAISDVTVVRGTELKLYTHTSDKTVDSVVALNQSVAQLTADPAVKNDKVKIYTDEKNFSLTTKTAAGYEDLKEDDVVLFVEMADGVTYFEKADSVTGLKDQYKKNNSTGVEWIILNDGKSYYKSELTNSEDNAGLYSFFEEKSYEDQIVLYLDRGGNVIRNAYVEDNSEYAMIIDAYRTINDSHDKSVYKVNALKTDGTETGYIEVQVDKDDVHYFQNNIDRKDVNYNSLGTLVTLTEKDGKTYLDVCPSTYDAQEDSWAEFSPYTKGDSAMKIDGVDYAVTSGTVAFYYTLDTVKNDRVIVHYGVNVGKGTIPTYQFGGDALYMVTGTHELKVTVLNANSEVAFSDYIYLTNIGDVVGRTKDQDPIYEVTGITADGTIKTLKSLGYIVGEDSQGHPTSKLFLEEGKVYAYGPNGLDDYSMFQPVRALLVSIEKIKDIAAKEATYAVKDEGIDGVTHYLNAASNDEGDRIWDAFTSYKADATKADTYTFSKNAPVQALIVLKDSSEDWRNIYYSYNNDKTVIDAAFVLNENYEYGTFMVDADGEFEDEDFITFYGPVYDNKAKEAVKYSYKDLLVAKYTLDEDAVHFFEKNSKGEVINEQYFNNVESDDAYNATNKKIAVANGAKIYASTCVNIEDIEVKYDGATTNVEKTSGKDEYTVTLPAHSTLDAATKAKITVTATNGTAAEPTWDGNVATVVIKNADGFCDKTIKITVVIADCNNTTLSWYGKEEAGHIRTFLYTKDETTTPKTLTVYLEGNENVSIQNLANTLCVKHTDGTVCNEATLTFWNSDEKNVIKDYETTLTKDATDYGITVKAGDGSTDTYKIVIVEQYNG